MSKLKINPFERIWIILSWNDEKALERYHDLEGTVKDVTIQDVGNTLKAKKTSELSSNKSLDEKWEKPDDLSTSDKSQKTSRWRKKSSRKKTTKKAREDLSTTLNASDEHILDSQKNLNKEENNETETKTECKIETKLEEKSQKEDNGVEDSDFNDEFWDDDEFWGDEESDIEAYDEDEEYDGGDRFQEFSCSLFNEIIKDPVMRYALEIHNRAFLRDMKKIVDIQNKITIINNKIKNEERIIENNINAYTYASFIWNKKVRKTKITDKGIARCEENIRKREANIENYTEQLRELQTILQEYKKSLEQKWTYETLKSKMIDEWMENIDYSGSMLEKIASSYVYFRVLENLDTKILKDLCVPGALSYSKYKDFAEKNGIDIVIWSIRSYLYCKWLEEQNLE